MWMWFGVIVPSHTRGVLQIPQSEAPIFVDNNRCGSAANLRFTQDQEFPPGPAPLTPPSDEEDPSSCLICHLIASLDAPTSGCVVPPVLEPIEIDSPRYVATRSNRSPLGVQARGPPEMTVGSA